VQPHSPNGVCPRSHQLDSFAVYQLSLIPVLISCIVTSLIRHLVCVNKGPNFVHLNEGTGFIRAKGTRIVRAKGTRIVRAKGTRIVRTKGTRIIRVNEGPGFVHATGTHPARINEGISSIRVKSAAPCCCPGWNPLDR
jgi:hypothetical protein